MEVVLAIWEVVSTDDEEEEEDEDIRNRNRNCNSPSNTRHLLGSTFCIYIYIYREII